MAFLYSPVLLNARNLLLGIKARSQRPCLPAPYCAKNEEGAYHPVAIGNYFIALGRQEKIKINLLKLIKLVYVAQGFHIALTGKILMDEAPEAWKYGPMVPTIFYTFRNRKAPFKKPAHILNEHTYQGWVRPDINEDDNATREILNWVWDIYKDFNADQLSTLTRGENSAWAEALKMNSKTRLRNRHITSNLLRKEFKLFLLSAENDKKTRCMLD